MIKYKAKTRIIGFHKNIKQFIIYVKFENMNDRLFQTGKHWN